MMVMIVDYRDFPNDYAVDWNARSNDFVDVDEHLSPLLSTLPVGGICDDDDDDDDDDDHDDDELDDDSVAFAESL